MAELILRDLEESLARKLEERAARHGVSAEEEHRRILRESLLQTGSKSSLEDYLLSIPPRGEGNPLEVEFLQRALRWKAQTALHSSIAKKAQHPDYQRIIGMGEAVVPLILRWLKHEPDFWFEALVAITGEQPMRPEHAGDIGALAADWLEWGRARGYDL